MGILISIIIPNYNGSRTIESCLQSIFACNDVDREVIVVDDCSGDGSVDIIKRYPCRLITMGKRSGASAARNAGAFSSEGDVLFFMDADCMLTKETIPIIRHNLSGHTPDVVIGGTYTPIPYDSGFFSLFQSVFINYSETKNSNNPDYLATHALAIHAETFKKMGGFREKFLPILEDVEFCHRLRSAGCTLFLDPRLQVMHQFNFSFLKSMKNAARKSRYWIRYSLSNRDLLADSGTASKEIKITGVSWLAAVLLALLSIWPGRREFLMPVPLLLGGSIVINRHLIKAFRKTAGIRFAIQAAVYFLILYPLPIWLGTFTAIAESIRPRKNRGRFSRSSQAANK